jgi:hypothetical protein
LKLTGVFLFLDGSKMLNQKSEPFRSMSGQNGRNKGAEKLFKFPVFSTNNI